MSQEIIRYIRENRGTYTDDAISRSLLAAGHNPEAVEAAWRAMESGQHTTISVRKQRIIRTPSFWLTLLGFPTVLIGLTVYIGYLGAPDYALLLFVTGLGLAGLTALGLVIARRRSAVAAGLAAGLAVAVTLLVLVPFVLIVIVAGMCLVSISRM